jgi:asparagine synthetase B (glutamine-hydrolysing)
LKHRGPDGFSEYKINIGRKWSANFAGSVLWMQGPELTKQPLIDDKHNILLWNGDVFSGLVVKKHVSVIYVMYHIATCLAERGM